MLIRGILLASILLLFAGSQARSAVPPLGVSPEDVGGFMEIRPCEHGEEGYPLTLPVRSRQTGQVQEMIVLFSEPIAKPDYLQCFYLRQTADGASHKVHIH